MLLEESKQKQYIPAMPGFFWLIMDSIWLLSIGAHFLGDNQYLCFLLLL